MKKYLVPLYQTFLSFVILCFLGVYSKAENTKTKWWQIIVPILASVFFIGICSYVIWYCYHHRCRNNQLQKQNPDTVETTYQELDVTKMNTEDNYQPLLYTTPNSNFELRPTEVDATYEELDTTKMNTEDNYQSLIVGVLSEDPENEDDSGYTDVKGDGPKIFVNC